MKIKRKLYSEVKKHLPEKEITLLVGARQVGKTTLIRELASELQQKGDQTLFFNLDIERDAVHFQSQEQLLARINLETGGRKAFVFIDEIQRKENAGLFLKGLYDQNLSYKWIVTGSGSLELKEKIHESLLGRKRVFEMFPVTLQEFIQYKTDYAFEEKLSEWLQLEREHANRLCLEYLNFGGYPRLVTASSMEEKQLLILEIFRTYVERDISILLGIEKTDAFTLLLRLLADRVGQIINYTDLATSIGLTIPTVKKYISYAEKTFTLKSIVPFFRNAGKELVKAPQVYFNDLGLRNFSLQRMGHFTQLSNAGFVFQNLIYLLLKQKYEKPSQPIKYWRTKSQAEVDFVLEIGLAHIPIEVKCKQLVNPVLSRSFQSFLKKYEPEEAWIVNLTLDDEIQFGKTTVTFIPWTKLI